MGKTLRILGTRGIPAAHGGFETFAEHLAIYLASKGWNVIVYCQVDGRGPLTRDQWNGITRVNIPVDNDGPLGTMLFDWRATSHAARFGDTCLTLGYNTAIFGLQLRIKKIPNLINMDGIEWSRKKWGLLPKIWLWLNELAGCLLGTGLIADHPEIRRHLSTRINPAKITMIPYGAERLSDVSPAPLEQFGLQPGNFLTVIARPEPENSLLEIVSGFSRKQRGKQLVVLGSYSDDVQYHRLVRAAASDEVLFLGAIYDARVVQALRFHCQAYVHGHQVGGTNPSLVEAMGSGNAVIAHDNRFNRWVAGEGALYFSNASQLSDSVEKVIGDAAQLLAMRTASSARFLEKFTWMDVLQQYEKLINKSVPPCI